MRNSHSSVVVFDRIWLLVIVCLTSFIKCYFYVKSNGLSVCCCSTMFNDIGKVFADTTTVTKKPSTLTCGKIQF